MSLFKELPGECLGARGSWSRPEETVGGSLVWIRLTLLSFDAWGGEVGGQEATSSATEDRGEQRRPGLPKILFACSVAGSGMPTGGGLFYQSEKFGNMVQYYRNQYLAPYLTHIGKGPWT